MRKVWLSVLMVVGSALSAGEIPETIGQFEKMSDFSPEIIDAGFVFINGKYLDAPYKMELKKVLKEGQDDTYVGGCIFYLNNTKIKQYSSTEYRRYKGDIDPQLPANINKNTALHDSSLAEYFRAKVAFVQKHYSREEEIKIMEDVFRALPNMKKVVRISANDAHIETFAGDISDVCLAYPRRKPLPLFRIYEQTIAQTQHFAEVLKNGGALFFTDESGDMTVTGIQDALKLVTGLNSGKSPEERMVLTHRFFLRTIRSSPIIGGGRG
ncbi:MAG: hypothetical protein PHQ27_02890 [Victivallales bacterium]|nr:hypothetical protein [Victivallales bacterium]